LADYVARLLHDRFARHEIMACLTLPDAWKLPKAMRKGIGKRGYAIYWNRLRVKTQSAPVLEISYQLFGEDLNIVRISVPDDKNQASSAPDMPAAANATRTTSIDPADVESDPSPDDVDAQDGAVLP
jgi:hypothetical protein